MDRGWEASGGWDTSDEENGMAIDLESGKQQDKSDTNYDPSEPTADDYDPADPTLSDNEETSQSSMHLSQIPMPGEEISERDALSPDSNGEETTIDILASMANTDNADNSLTKNGSPAGDVTKSGSPSKSVSPAKSDSSGDGRWNSQSFSLVEYNSESNDSPRADTSQTSQSHSVDDVSRDDKNAHSQEEKSEAVESDENNSAEKGVDNLNMSFKLSSSHNDIDMPEEEDSSQPLATVDDVNSEFSAHSDVPDVTFDSDFVLEKENYEDKRPEVSNNDNNQSSGEEQERLRKQEEIDTRNQEALVDIFREDSEAERIEEDLQKSPTKKGKKKVAGTKKIKKKVKKVKKGLGKKGANKQPVGEEDERFVEIRKDRQSEEDREEGEVDNDNSLQDRNKGDDLSLSLYEQAFDIGGEPREPGEIVEMEGGKKKRGKKGEKKEKKKKKNKREVATIEEGIEGEDDSQKFPSFLAGFFVQDEENGEVEGSVERESYTIGENEGIFHRKNYRKRHGSEADDSSKEFEPEVEREVSPDPRDEEVEQRRSRRREERERRHGSGDGRRGSRERRHSSREGRMGSRERRFGSREGRREKDSRTVTSRDRNRDRGSNRDREREVGRDREVGRETQRERLRREREEDERRGERRRRRSRSRSVDRRRRSRSRDRSARRRRQRSRERSQEREKEREKERRERLKRRQRERSADRGSSRRRRVSASRSRSPRQNRRLDRGERAGSDKENRDMRHRNRSDSNEFRQRLRRRARPRSESSSSSSSSSSPESSPPRRVSSSRLRSRGRTRSSSEDEGTNSDVILVEPERIVINLDEEPDPPSRVDITHGNRDDVHTVVDGESIPPPPDMAVTGRGSTLISLTTDTSRDDEGGDETPTRDEPTDVERRENQSEADYDPENPTEDPEDKAPSTQSTPYSSPVPPPLPPPERPTTPPRPPTVAESGTQTAAETVQTLPPARSPFFTQPPPPIQQQNMSQPPPLMQQQQNMMRFPGMNGPGNGPQRMPWMPGNMRPQMPQNGPQMQQNGPQMPQNGPQNFSPARPPMSGHRPPLFMRPPMGEFNQDNRQPPPFTQRSSGDAPVRPMGALAQLTSLLPALEKANRAGGKAPLASSSVGNVSQGESTEVVDMDMSPGEEDCELELHSPPSPKSDDDRRSRKQKPKTIQPYLKALSKVIEKLAPKDGEKAKRRRKVPTPEDDVPGSAVDLTNKEKFMKKLQFQERVIDELKMALKPFYASKKITKEQYKLILRKAVPKVCHSKSSSINPQRIQQLVEAYVGKMKKGQSLGGKKKSRGNKAGKGDQKGSPMKQNGAKKAPR